MYRVHSKNKNYTGKGVYNTSFSNGVALVEDDNEKAIEVYRKKGFKVVEGIPKDNIISTDDVKLFEEFKEHYQEFKEWLEAPKEVDEETPKEVNFDAMKRLELDDYVAKNKIELPQECNTVDAIKKFLKEL